MVVTLWARLPLLDPSFVLKVAKTGPSYGPHKVHWKSDFMKKTYHIQDQHLAMFKTTILPQDLKWLLEAETHIAPMVITIWTRSPLLEPTFVH